jgi:hypothetical protein
MRKNSKPLPGINHSTIAALGGTVESSMQLFLAFGSSAIN